MAVRRREDLKSAEVPLAFLGQLDLEELHSAVSLTNWPSEGTLAFFYAVPECAWGFDPLMKGHCRVIYFSTTERTGVFQPPDDLPDDARFPKRAVTFQPEWTLPNSIDAGEVKLSVWGDDNYADVCRDIMSIPNDDDPPIHRCGGHPQEIQGDMRRECQLVTHGIYCGDQSASRDPRTPLLERGAADWQLLLQIDSDENRLGWMWGDAGRLYFSAHQQDIAERDFDRSWAVLQCY